MLRLGLIGSPIKHSLSPWIHRHLLQRANIPGSYELFEIHSGRQLSRAMKQLKEQLHGFNVTVPYKETIIPHLDMLDDTARYCGAVNTVVKIKNQWIGYNTDGIGYIRSLQASYPQFFSRKKNKVLIIGAGGAARGIYFSLIDEGFINIDIANRTVKNAKEMVRDSTIPTKVYDLKGIHDMIHSYDLIIQTTSVGMHPLENETVISLSNIKPDTIVSDIVYQPVYTKFLKEARSLKANIHFGHMMLLYQAIYAFEIWTGKHVQSDDLAQRLKNKLERN